MKNGLRLLAITAALLAGPARAGEVRDPMRPAGTPTAARPAPVHSLKLEGVIAGEKRVAIVNGRLVRAGDVIAGARILEVFATGVRYERAGKVSTLTLSVAQSNTNVRVARSDKKSESK
jgi:MSHA biogenesis protein MshK